MKNFTPLKNKLDSLVEEKNTNKALFESPDPLQVAKFHNDEFIALLCAYLLMGMLKI